MRDKINKSLAVFGIVLIVAMFANIASFIGSQNSPNIESHVISAFVG